MCEQKPLAQNFNLPHFISRLQWARNAHACRYHG